MGSSGNGLFEDSCRFRGGREIERLNLNCRHTNSSLPIHRMLQRFHSIQFFSAQVHSCRWRIS